uniref:Secreted protein n=1 Tax=Arion vulgaris TaxID=1028688 RepID=A0A0B7AYA4_9EUPU
MERFTTSMALRLVLLVTHIIIRDCGFYPIGAHLTHYHLQRWKGANKPMNLFSLHDSTCGSSMKKQSVS